MASKYLQKYPVPLGFQQILHDFTRQILRDQPDNIIEYAAQYFQMLEQGKKFQYDSQFNVKKSDKKTNLEYNSKAASDVTNKAKNAVNLINQNIEKYGDQGYKGETEKGKSGGVSVGVGVGTQKEEEVERKHPSIQDVTKNVEERPVSGVSVGKKSEVSVGYHPSTNTMMNTEGRKFINQVNSGATKEIVNEEQNIQKEKEIQANLDEGELDGDDLGDDGEEGDGGLFGDDVEGEGEGEGQEEQQEES